MGYYLEFDYKAEELLGFYDTYMYRLEKDIDLDGMGVCADFFQDMINAIINIVEKWPEEYKDELRRVTNG